MLFFFKYANFMRFLYLNTDNKLFNSFSIIKHLHNVLSLPNQIFRTFTSWQQNSFPA